MGMENALGSGPVTIIFKLANPILKALPPETAHGLTLRALASGLVPGRRRVDEPVLRVRLPGLEFPNPIGLAAGFDKNAQAPDRMLGQGFGFVEVGTVTPLAQPGNPKPRVFRLTDDEAVINRLGFNNAGMTAVAARLRDRRRRGVVGVNLGANKDSADWPADYVTGFKALAPYADYVTVNVSSPNTPGLRRLQGRAELEDLLGRLRAARAEVGLALPIALKIAPDLDDRALADIVDVAVLGGVGALIVANTTIARPAGLVSRHRDEAGGLSGRPLFGPATEMLTRAARLARGRLVLIGVGGVASGQDAYAKIRAGATLVQLYTALIYHGPGLVGRINRDLFALLRRDGFDSVQAAVGADL